MPGVSNIRQIRHAQSVPNTAFLTLRNGAGNASSLYTGSTGGDSAGIGITSTNSGDRFGVITRSAIIFDTSSITASNVVVTATLSRSGWYSLDNQFASNTFGLNVYGYGGSKTTNVNSDFAQYSATQFSTTRTYPATPISFVLNAAGIAAINTTGLTALALREANYDAAGVTPAGQFSAQMYLSQRDDNTWSLTYTTAPNVPPNVLFRMT